MDMMPIDKLLPKLNKVKLGKAGQLIACCPAHDDKSPSLKVTETAEGVVLLKCWAGCTAAEIVAAVNLELRDLFPAYKPVRRGPSRQAIEHERTVYQIGLSEQQRGCKLNTEDQARFELAKQRLGVTQ
jgi:hypothetical protein